MKQILIVIMLMCSVNVFSQTLTANEYLYTREVIRKTLTIEEGEMLLPKFPLKQDTSQVELNLDIKELQVVINAVSLRPWREVFQLMNKLIVYAEKLSTPRKEESAPSPTKKKKE